MSGIIHCGSMIFALQSFTAAAREDKEEWVSMTARAVGDLKLPLDFQSFLSSSAIVSFLRSTVFVLQTQHTPA